MDIAPFATIADAKEFLDFSARQKENRKSFRYSIRCDGQFAGTVCVYSIYWHQNRASIGYALGQDYWQRGIMNHVLDEIETILRVDYGINRLQATVLPDNSGSKRLLEKRGFSREGLLLQYEKWEGKGFVDLEMYAKIIGKPD
jgi:ribosomal-protein-alanine N-acetyltransferase